MSNTVQAYIIHPGTTGTLTRITPTLEGLQEHLDGGWLEAIHPTRGNIPWHAYCDEEGKLKNLGMNRFATILARTLGWYTEDFLVGTIIFLGSDEEGEEADVPTAVIDIVELLTKSRTTPTTR
jgi:Domain of unknown function (DUF3846)